MSTNGPESSIEQRRPLVSVITPTYNRADLLAETLDSLLAQDYAPLELIVLDDGSTDRTPELLAEYAARNADRLRWARHDNMGQARSINRGFSMAQGELLAVVNSDDPQPPGLLGPLVECLVNAPDVVVAYPDWEMIDHEGKYIRTLRTLDFSFADMVRWIECVPGPGALFRRRLIDAVGGWNPDLHYCPDYAWFLRAGLVGPFKRVPLPIAQWRSHEGSITVSAHGEAKAREMVRVVEEFFARHDLPADIQAVRREAFRNVYIVAGLVVAPDQTGPGSRYTVTDRLADLQVDPELRRQPVSQTPLAQVPLLHRTVSEHVETIRWLHREVAERDKTIAWLHAEVAIRDRLVAQLQAEASPRGGRGRDE